MTVDTDTAGSRRARASEGSEHEGLVGVEDSDIPQWIKIEEQLVAAGLWRIAAAAARMAAVVARWSWRSAPGLTALATLAQLASGVATAGGLLATASVFTRLLEQGPTPDRVVAALPALAWVVGAHAAGALLSTGAGALQSALAPQLERMAADELYAAVIGVDLVAFDDAEFAELVENASGNALHQLRQAATIVGDLLASLVSMGAAVVTAALLHPALGPLVLATAVPQGWANITAAKIAYEHFLRMMSRARRLSITGGLITDRTDAAEVRAFTTQPVLLAEHRRIATALAREAMRAEHRKTWVRLVGRTLGGVGTGAAYVVLGVLIYIGALPLALAGAAALAMRTASTAVANTVYISNRLFETSLYHDLYQACLTGARARTRRHPPATAVPRAPALDGWAPSLIEVRDVTFSYPDQARPALADITLTLRAGEVVALVGENGSGKSTLARLLTGLYLPDRGTIGWDGVDIATVAPAELQSRVAMVMQGPTRWPMTAANNVRIGRIEADDPDGRRLAGATTRSGADAVLAELPDGPDTMLSRRFRTGRDLSGGQWQRIAVARGLYRDAALVIADEPTAALDARAEHAVFTTLRELPRTESATPRERITVLITHRLANVRHADQIVVLDQGRVEAVGEHQELMARPGTYRDLYTLQSRAYRDGHG
ncbi:ABC transporter ATP-binding protein [Pseudonocardia acaciae]|uniref:ABC transporter ATP-binding protein n=1 Tax=Pseudonocardia acaciae TaxID=551276 RepID=UPI001FDED090|nr:ABC transporter ATP-binding protein [Pseudonocardia acaciae]